MTFYKTPNKVNESSSVSLYNDLDGVVYLLGFIRVPIRAVNDVASGIIFQP